MLSQDFFLEKLTQLVDIPSPRFLLAVSGGVDSMVLLHLFQSSKKGSFGVAHVNYKLRGTDSDLDQKLVQEYCHRYGIPFYVYEVSEQDRKPNGSVQLWARDLRYHYFRTIKEHEKWDYIVTAHHLNDQVETFLINLFRGSGLAGLTGIPSKENQILRPLLEVSKEEIYVFAREGKIDFREDISNQKNDYQRNKIRNCIIPELSKINPHFLKNFQKSLDILGEGEDFIASQICEKMSALTLEKSENMWILDREKLAQESNFVKFEILKKIGFRSETEISKIFLAETGKTFWNKDYSLSINRNELIIRNKLNLTDNEEVIELEFSELEDYYEIQLIGKTEFWRFSKQQIQPPFSLRPPRKGDEFQPMGMKGKKSVQKFLKDEKLSFLERKSAKILCDRAERILGVFPLRRDGRYEI